LAEDQANQALLGCAFRRDCGLRVGVERDAAVGVAQEFLDDLDISPLSLSKQESVCRKV